VSGEEFMNYALVIVGALISLSVFPYMINAVQESWREVAYLLLVLFVFSLGLWLARQGIVWNRKKG